MLPAKSLRSIEAAASSQLGNLIFGQTETQTDAVGRAEYHHQRLIRGGAGDGCR